MAMHRLQLTELRARKCQKLLPDALEMLADDIELRIRQEMMNVGDAAGDRILDRDHGELGFATLHRGERILEGRAWQRLHVRIGIATGEMRVGAWLALEGDFVGSRFGHWCRGQGSTAGLQEFTRPRKFGRSIDTEGDGVNEGDVDA